jgi:endonuclease/exonuclease/phosphatase family metal-dependent hydrolase
VLLAIGLYGSMRRPAGGAEGGPIEPVTGTGSAPISAVDTTTAGTTRPAHVRGPDRLRLAAFNIHSGVGQDGRFDLSRTADLLKGFDLIALNEVRAGGPWWDDNAQTLGSLLGMRSLFAPTETRWWIASFGNGLLTRTRIDRWARTQLESGPRMAHRNNLRLQVPFGSGTLNVLMVHVGRRTDRERHLQTLTDTFLKLPEPAIMMGDFNTPPDDPIIRRMLASEGVEDPVGQRLPNARDRIDFILTRGVRWIDAGLVETKASDHPMVWVEIEAK